MAKFTGKMRFFKKLFFSSLVVFGGLLVFEIWLLLYQVDFDACDLMNAKDFRDFFEHDSDARIAKTASESAYRITSESGRYPFFSDG